MADTRGFGLWMRRASYLALSLLILFFQLLPLDTGTPRWAPPDLLVALTFAWAVRRPDFVPALSVAAMMLLADLLLQRPPGLLAALVVLGAEWLKRRAPELRDDSFLTEWLSVASVIVVVSLGYRVVLNLLAVAQPQLGLYLMQLLMTMAVYPVVVGICYLFFGLQKPAASDLDTRGIGA
ncbi:rod shape-determining protein MreD [Rhodosalinus sp. 5P4]|uniref:rod shape-determining protein MreD n=1 Tax=Rhodosalinus sp. 5P4 TaxID=3239196 RepID=UPI003523A821